MVSCIFRAFLVKNVIGILGSTDILTILIHLIREYGICFHLFVSSSIFDVNVLEFSIYRSFASLVKLIPKYF